MRPGFFRGRGGFDEKEHNTVLNPESTGKGTFGKRITPKITSTSLKVLKVLKLLLKILGGFFRVHIQHKQHQNTSGFTSTIFVSSFHKQRVCFYAVYLTYISLFRQCQYISIIDNFFKFWCTYFQIREKRKCSMIL